MAPPLAVFLTLFYCIPRISGSVRAKRVSTSDVDPPFRLNHTVNGNPSHTFLSATSPGFFLNLQISRHTSLVKFYGHKCSGASLYGVHLACSSESFEIADGYDPSIPTRLDTQPSCIFSLSIDPRENVSLELYNLYDRRFGEYGTVTFSFAEYIPQDEGSSVHDQICGHHLDFSNNTSTLLPRDGGESSSTSLSQPDSVMSGKLNIVIGLLTALIVIFLAVVVVVTTYVLRLRRQAVLDRFKKDPKVKSGKNQNDTADAFLESTTATETLQVRSQDQGGTSSKNRYLEDHQPSVYTNPTSSLSTRVETDKPVSPSRPQFRNKPPTSPPREPVPEVPKVPFPLPTIQCKGNEINCSSSGSATYPNSGMTVSQARPSEPRNPENLMDQRAGSTRPAQTKIPHSRFSKPLPGILSEIPLPSPSHNNRPIAHFPESSGSSNDLPRYIDPKGRQAEVRDQTIHGPTTTRVGLDSSNQISMHPKLEHIKTPEEARQGARSLHQDLPRTRVEYETPIKVSGDSRWKDTDTTNLQDRKKLKQDTQRTRVHESPPQHDAIEIAELSLQLPADPEAWLNLLWEQERLAEPVKNNDRSQLEVLQITRPPVSPADASLRASRRSARIEPNQQDAGESKPTVTLTQYHRHEETTTQPKQEDTRIPIHSPPRALPRPPF
ncbi:hypothetical protein AGABI2DRAFT_176033 [Agaricus bisporus var. bisporus H97]|uniref:hypothetical protein n=1 Tax=Agaricus bisporus var. bisporus (strain H97 / ATCC MYA-4626 / FGSC 10389) TaxID=936046 RepID=UPI00029F6230|nr:hypothetical protein AGABI2DRAFT_176033 [Agaricus bisporus var. bisporus H97]EKV51522.1 hypothetical protein AGABI2DRAFT_176033 [Agaricus bisporus var. bisporus H97]